MATDNGLQPSGVIKPQGQGTFSLTPTTTLVDDPAALVDDATSLTGSLVTYADPIRLTAVNNSAKGKVYNLQPRLAVMGTTPKGSVQIQR